VRRIGSTLQVRPDRLEEYRRRHADMAEFFEPGRPNQHMHVLSAVFHLDDQLGDSDD